MMSVSSAIDINYIWPICGVLIIINWAHILWSFQLDLLDPKLRDYAETGKVEGNKNANKSVIIGLVMGLVTGVIAILLLYEDVTIGWYKIVFISLAFLLFRIFLFVKNLRVFFKRIEY